MNITNLKNSILCAVSILMLSLFLAGCQHEVLKNEKSKVTPNYSKSGPVVISSKVAKTISPNVYFPVVLNFKLSSARDIVTVSLQPSQGLSIAGSVGGFTLDITDPNSVEAKELSVLAEAEGLYYLNVFVQTEKADTKSVQTVVVPILVGDKSAKSYLKSNGEQGEDSEGRPVVVMPAYEPGLENNK